MKKDSAQENIKNECEKTKAREKSNRNEEDKESNNFGTEKTHKKKLKWLNERKEIKSWSDKDGRKREKIHGKWEFNRKWEDRKRKNDMSEIIQIDIKKSLSIMYLV